MALAGPLQHRGSLWDEVLPRGFRFDEEDDSEDGSEDDSDTGSDDGSDSEDGSESDGDSKGPLESLSGLFAICRVSAPKCMWY